MVYDSVMDIGMVTPSQMPDELDEDVWNQINEKVRGSSMDEVRDFIDFRLDVFDSSIIGISPTEIL